MKYLHALLLCLFVVPAASAVHAQASANLNTPVNEDELVLFAYEIDFSTATAPLRVEFTGGTSGGEARVTLIDIDGSFNGNSAPWDGESGTTFDVGIDAPLYTGVHLFIVSVITENATTSTGVTGTISVPGLPAGAVSFQASQVLFEERLELHTGFDRAVMLLRDYAQPGVYTYRFDVDYGATAQAAEIDLRVLGTGMNAVQMFEISPAGTRLQIEQADADATGNLEQWQVSQTSSRSGLVTFEVDVDVASAGGEVDWLAVVSNNVEVVPITPDSQSFTSTVTDGIERLHRFRVDYGPTPREAIIKLDVSRVAGTAAVTASLIDIDTTTETAALTESDVLVNGSGEFRAELTTGEHSGVREFVVVLRHENLSASGSTTLDGSLTALLSDLGGIAPAGTDQFNPAESGPTIVFNRVALLHETGLAAGTHEHAVQADFGGTAHDYALFLSGQDVQSMTVYQVEAGNETQIFSQSGGASNTISTSVPLTAAAGTGLVNLRVEAQTLANAEIEWTLMVPAAVTLSEVSAGGTSSGTGTGSGGGCIARPATTSQVIALLLILGALALRRRRVVRVARG